MEENERLTVIFKKYAVLLMPHPYVNEFMLIAIFCFSTVVVKLTSNPVQKYINVR